MKPYFTLFVLLLIGHLSLAQNSSNPDTAKKTADEKIFTSVERFPEFPGGIPAFYKYISKNVKYPNIARLIGINGKVNVSFVVGRDGKITNVNPTNCIGAGCEAEAEKVLEMSPRWVPGIQNGKAVQVRFTVPITFTIEKGKVMFKSLRASNYGFIFNIKGALYTIDEAEKILGNSLISDQIEIAEPFYNYNKVEKFEIQGKKEVYLLIFKPS